MSQSCNRIKTLHLNGEDAINLAHTLFSPTKEEIAERKRLREERDKQIKIRRTKTGFNAEIEGLRI